MALNNFGVKNLSEYYAGGPYYIPEYQREYSWEAKNEVVELWNDIIDVKDKNIGDYFLGQLVVHNCVTHEDNIEKSKKYIIDGQQRTVTLTLLFLAMKSVFNDILISSENDSNKDSARKYSQKIDSLLGIIDKNDREEKLFLGEGDGTYFRDKILYTPLDEITMPRPKSRRNIVSALQELKNRIETELMISDNEVENVCELEKLYNVCISNLKLLYVETTNESEAFMIFETLNARGRDLETADLLKNHFFRVCTYNIEDVKKKWYNLTESFSECKHASLTNFMRTMWNAEKKFVREKMLYKEITSDIKNEIKVNDYLEKLLDAKELYLAMVEPESQFCFTSTNGHDELQDSLLDLSDLSVKTCYPVLIAYYLRFSKNENLVHELTEIAKAIEKIIVRDIVIQANSPASYEVFFADLAKDISEKNINSVEDIVNAIKDKSVGEETFRNSFINYTCQDTAQGKNKVRYILRKIINTSSRELVLKRKNTEIHIEHIMPQTIGEWNVSEDEHKEYLWRLGNLALLDFQINEVIQNGLYDIKAEEYKKSDIKMNKEMKDTYSEWNTASIMKRQSDLYEFAKEIWSF